MARQLVLDLPVTPSFRAEDFLPGAANETALALLERWPHWPDLLLRLEGAKGSGKSHLASIWADRAGAAIVPAAEIAPDVVPRLSECPALVIEDIDRMPQGAAESEGALFHLLNRMRELARSVFLTSTKPPDLCGFRTLDLLSRLRRAPVIHLEAPDDGLLKAVLVKLFHDRQLTVEANVVDYVAGRMERSLAAAGEIVEAMDREALSLNRRVTRPVAARILEAFASRSTEET